MDKITLSGMTFHGYHGVLPEEQDHGQAFEVDVEVAADLHPSARRDDLALSVDYRRVYALVKEVMEGKRFQLLEALAEAIAQRLLNLERVMAVTVRVRKPHVKLAGPLAYAEVEITRTRGSGA